MDLEDIRQLNAVLDMRQDCEAAVDAWQNENLKAEQRRRGN